jgi:rod shape-determining protein MreC
MESFFVRFKNALVLVTLLLVQTILLAVQVRDLRGPGEPDGRKITLLRSWAVAAVAPFERFTSFSGHSMRGGWANYIDLRHTRQRNADLEKEIARLRLEQAQFAEDAIQGRRLQSLLDFRRQYVTSTVAAQVIGTSGVDSSRVLLIDKGADVGLKSDMAVITPDGIVGKIRDVFPHTAQVLEIDDPSSGAGVILASTRIRAIIHGGPDGRVQIGNLTADSRIKSGEIVLTSGGDQVFPRGLKVGVIDAVAPDKDRQLYSLINIKPAVNLSQLEEVLIITSTQADLTAQAQQDLAQGQATGEQIKADAKRAADLAAERLPSLAPPPNADGSPAADPAAASTSKPGDPPKPVLIVPKVIPVLHPDRYSPGQTPPASNLTPGGQNSNSSPATLPDSSTDSPETAPAPKPRKKPVTPPAATSPTTLPSIPTTPPSTPQLRKESQR